MKEYERILKPRASWIKRSGAQQTGLVCWKLNAERLVGFVEKWFGKALSDLEPGWFITRWLLFCIWIWE